MKLDNPCRLSDERLATIAGEAGQQTSLRQLLEWGRNEPGLFAAAGVLSNVVVQDEFTHDVVAALTSGLVLVYDST